MEVEKDDKQRTKVTIALGSADAALRDQLITTLSKLPQTYMLLPARGDRKCDR